MRVIRRVLPLSRETKNEKRDIRSLSRKRRARLRLPSFFSPQRTSRPVKDSGGICARLSRFVANFISLKFVRLRKRTRRQHKHEFFASRCDFNCLHSFRLVYKASTAQISFYVCFVTCFASFKPVYEARLRCTISANIRPECRARAEKSINSEFVNSKSRLCQLVLIVPNLYTIFSYKHKWMDVLLIVV